MVGRDRKAPYELAQARGSASQRNALRLGRNKYSRATGDDVALDVVQATPDALGIVKTLVANQAPERVTDTRTARVTDRIVHASAFDLTAKPHRSAPVRLRRLTDPRRDPVGTDLGGASPYHPRITQPSPTGQTLPD